VVDVAARARAMWRPRSLVPWASLAVAASAAWLVASWIARPWVGGDTPFVLDGSNAFLDCLSAHDFVGCRHSEHLDYWGLTSPIGDWPLLQHVPDLIAIGLGASSHPDRTRILALLSVVGVVGTAALGRLVLARAGQAAWFWGFAAVLLSGPDLAYARTTAGEMLAAGLMVCLVAAALLPAPAPLVGLAALAACLTKETAYPFVAVLGVLGLILARRRTGRPIRHHVLWGVGGIALALVLASLFNVVRFGSVLNTNYLEPQLHTPGLLRKVEYTVAVLVAPNGGILEFWPAAAVLVLLACVLPFASGGRLDRRPALVLAAVVLALSVGFASWWTPFGWSAYGPRLMLPWVPALVLVALVAYAEPLGDLARRALSPAWSLLLLGGVVTALALPHVGYTWRTETLGGFFGQVHPPCEAPWRGGEARWYACQHEQMWFGRPMLTYTIEGVETAGGAVTSVAVAIGVLGCLVLLRDGLLRRTQCRSAE
jgi:hypothetical protein